MCTCTISDRCYSCRNREIRSAVAEAVQPALNDSNLLSELLSVCDSLACEIDFRERMGRPSHNYNRVVNQYALVTARARKIA